MATALGQVVAGDGAWVFIDGYNRDCASWIRTVPNGGHRPKFSLWDNSALTWDRHVSGYVPMRRRRVCGTGSHFRMRTLMRHTMYGVPVVSPTPFPEGVEEDQAGRSFTRLAKNRAYRDGQTYGTITVGRGQI